MALSDDSMKDFAIEYIDKAVEKCKTDRIHSRYSEQFGNIFDPDSDVQGNVLYLGHLNLMMGALQLLSGTDKNSDLQKRITDTLSENILSEESYHIETEKYCKWPADNVVGLASIDLYDFLNKTDHSEAISKWKEWTLENNIDDNGLMYSHINTITNKPNEEARGCAMGWNIAFISMFDKEFSSDLYDNYKNTMIDPLLGIPFVREWLTDGHKMNVDSGPVIYGRGFVASAFGIAASKANHDEETFSSLSLAAEIASLPYETFTEKGYLSNVSLGESVLLWSRTLRPWKESVDSYAVNDKYSYVINDN